jgi:hypothetical protein
MKKAMNFYITVENKEFLKKNFLNLRFFSLISVPEIIETLGDNYETMTDYNKFIANKTIERQVENVLKRKRFYSIIYSNPWLDYEGIKNLHEQFKDNPHIKNIILLDKKSKPLVEDLWQCFSEVTFFPEAKKKRIVECESFKTPMFYWSNNLEMPEEMKDKYPERSPIDTSPISGDGFE